MRSLLLVPTLTFALSTTAQSLFPAQLQPLVGTWRGELMYMDYSSGAETHDLSRNGIPADLVVEPLGERTWLVGFGYSDEPHANQRDTMRLSTDGIWLDTHQVVSVQQPTTDSLILLLQEHGTDNDAPVLIRKIWWIGRSTCTLRKEVQPLATSSAPFALRHEYRFNRDK